MRCGADTAKKTRLRAETMHPEYHVFPINTTATDRNTLFHRRCLLANLLGGLEAIEQEEAHGQQARGLRVGGEVPAGSGGTQGSEVVAGGKLPEYGRVQAPLLIVDGGYQREVALAAPALQGWYLPGLARGASQRRLPYGQKRLHGVRKPCPPYSRPSLDRGLRGGRFPPAHRGAGSSRRRGGVACGKAELGGPKMETAAGRPTPPGPGAEREQPAGSLARPQQTTRGYGAARPGAAVRTRLHRPPSRTRRQTAPHGPAGPQHRTAPPTRKPMHGGCRPHRRARSWEQPGERAPEFSGYDGGPRFAHQCQASWR